MEENIEISKNNQSSGKTIKGGARPGAGRPQGSVSEAMKERQEALAQFKDMVTTNTHKLFEAQYSMAVGSTFLVKVTFLDEAKTMKTSTTITDQQEILDYFSGKLEDINSEIYLMTTSKPDLRAIDSLLDRTYGKSKESIEVDDKRQRKILKVEVIDGRNSGTTN